MADPCSINIHPGGIRDILGNGIGFFINGTDEDVGVVDMTALAGDYVADTNSPDGTFRIAVEVAGVIEVQLADLTDFTITSVMATKYVGDWLPLNIRTVYKTGLRERFS
jgi:hypothetical protein